MISGTSDLSGGVDCEGAESGPNYQVCNLNITVPKYYYVLGVAKAV